MHYLAIFGKFDRPGDSENVWDDRCEEGLEDQPIVQLGAWRLYHAECLHLVHLEIIYDSLHSLLLKTIPNFDKFIGQNFAPLQQYWDKSRHTTAESQYIWFSLISNWTSGPHQHCPTLPSDLFPKHRPQWRCMASLSQGNLWWLFCKMMIETGCSAHKIS